MKPFHAVVLVIFALLALGSVFIFASFSGGGNKNVGTVVIWGTVSKDAMQSVLSSVQAADHGYDKVSYQQYPESSFLPMLTEAIAAGRGPDLVTFPTSEVIESADKLIPISYRAMSRRAFQDAYIEAGEVMLTDTGILGLPFTVDPLVTYWNRTRYANAGIARPPQYWDELTDMAPKLSQVTEAGTLTQSAVALGEWDNVAHAKEILTSLIVGLGNKIVIRNATGAPQVVMTDKGTAPIPPSESAVRFYTDFADPGKPTYSWNRSQKSSRDAFLAGTLATYFGLGSEAAGLRAANPNLNFDLAAYPSVRGGVVAVPAEVLALAIPRGSHNPTGALKVAITLTAVAAQTKLHTITGLPSVRRDILASAPQDPYEGILRTAALNAFGFLDPSPAASDAIFKKMIDDVSSGRLSITTAIANAQAALALVLKVQ